MLAAEQNTSLLDLALPIIPWLVIFVFVFFIVRHRVRGDRLKAQATIDRAKMHWDIVEAKLDRVIELLERNDRTK